MAEGIIPPYALYNEKALVNRFVIWGFLAVLFLLSLKESEERRRRRRTQDSMRYESCESFHSTTGWPWYGVGGGRGMVVMGEEVVVEVVTIIWIRNTKQDKEGGGTRGR